MHDPLCYVAINDGNCCPWMPSCDCQCMCDFINEIRQEERNNASALVVAYFKGFPSLAPVHVNWLRDALLRGEVSE